MRLLRFLAALAGLPGCWLVSPPIGQALADDPGDCLLCTLGILDAKGRALVVAEVELAEVALQVLRADVVIGADQAALQDREVRLDRVRVPEVAAHVLF